MSRVMSKKKIGAVAVAGLLVAGIAGSGAVTTLYTSIANNHFQATIPDKDTEVTGALLTLSGDPLVHTFNTSVYGDRVQGTWTLTNSGNTAAPYNGTLAPVGTMSDSLAKALTVQYGVENTEGVISWHDAGTLAAPLTYAQATNTEHSINGGAKQEIPVRVVLQDPTALEGEPGADLSVNATFTVSYVDPNSAA